MSNRNILSIAPYWDIIHRHRMSSFCTMVAGLAATALALVLIPRQYTSTVLLEIQPAMIKSSASSSDAPTVAANDQRLEFRLESLSHELLTSGNLQGLIKKFDLYHDNGITAPDAEGRMGGAISITIPDTLVQASTQARWQRSFPPDVVQISFEYPDPAKAQSVVGALADMMIVVDQKQRTQQNTDTIKLIESELAETDSKLTAIRGDIKNLEEKYRGSLPQDMDNNVRELDLLKSQLAQAKQAEYSAAERSRGTGAAQKSAPETALADLKNKLVALRARYSDEYPEVIETKEEIATLEQETSKAPSAPAVIAPRRSSVADLQRQIDECQKRVAATPAHEEQLASVKRDFGFLTAHYNDLTSALFEARAMHEVLDRGQGERLWVLQPANLPGQPSYPNRLAVVGGGLVASLLLAIGIPFGLFYSDPSFKDSEDVESEFSDVTAIPVSWYPEVDPAPHRKRWRMFAREPKPVLSVPVRLTNGAAARNGGNHHPAKGGPIVLAEHDMVDAPAQERKGMNGQVSVAAQKFQERFPAPICVSAGDGMVTSAADEFQLLAFRLQMWATERKAKVFVVASAVGGEGKSFVALNL
ncbi:MAG TPA: hypothetical protein VMT58_09845, partial [Candidatus Binataceae bacterium]|nr:hypothetical protein [Candidatus Binataceae bacterium]